MKNSEPRIKSLINKFNDQFSLKHRVISRYISLPLCRCLTFPFTSQVYKRLICKSQFSRSQRNAYSYDLKFKTFKSWLRLSPWSYFLQVNSGCIAICHYHNTWNRLCTKQNMSVSFTTSRKPLDYSKKDPLISQRLTVSWSSS